MGVGPYPTSSRSTSTFGKLSFPHPIDNETLSILCPKKFLKPIPSALGRTALITNYRNTIQASFAKKGIYSFSLLEKFRDFEDLKPE